jgi:hypothetical protein
LLLINIQQRIDEDDLSFPFSTSTIDPATIIASRKRPERPKTPAHASLATV